MSYLECVYVKKYMILMSSHYVSVLLTFLRKKSLSVWYMSFPFQSKLSSSLLSVREMCIPKTGVSSPTCLPAPFLFRPLRWFHDCPFGYLLVCRKFEQFLLESSDLMFSTFLRQTNFLFIFASVSRIFSVSRCDTPHTGSETRLPKHSCHRPHIVSSVSW